MIRRLTQKLADHAERTKERIDGLEAKRINGLEREEARTRAAEAEVAELMQTLRGERSRAEAAEADAFANARAAAKAENALQSAVANERAAAGVQRRQRGAKPPHLCEPCVGDAVARCVAGLQPAIRCPGDVRRDRVRVLDVGDEFFLRRLGACGCGHRDCYGQQCKGGGRE
jgi:hypothetical protein